MSKIQLGKNLKDVPIKHIKQGLRVAAKSNVNSNCIIGTVFHVKQDTYNNVSTSPIDGAENIVSGEKQDLIVVDFDGGPIMSFVHSEETKLFFVEHEGK